MMYFLGIFSSCFIFFGIEKFEEDNKDIFIIVFKRKLLERYLL